jgi:hypothetical protein
MPDGTSNVMMFANRYGVCGTSQAGVGNGAAWALYGTNSTTASWGGGGAFFGQTISPTLSATGADTYNIKPNNTGSVVPYQVSPTQPGGTNPCDPQFAHSYGSGGIQVGLGDGSVRTVAPSISQTTWARAVIPNDGFTLDSDWGQ